VRKPQPPAGEIILNYDDYLNLPDDGNRYEILEGVLYVTPSPNTRHQRISRNLGFLLFAFVKKHDLGEFFYAPLDVIFSHINIAQPDLIFVSREREDILTEKNVRGAPDLVVEILSSSTAERDRFLKAQLYARYDVDYYWVLNPEAEIMEEYRREGQIFQLVERYQGRVKVQPAFFPGLTLDLGEVWE